MQLHSKLHSVWHYIQYISNPVRLRAGSEALVATENNREHSEMKTINPQARIWLGYGS